MKEKNNISHSQISGYVQGNLSDATMTELKEKAKKDPVMALFLSIIDGFISKTGKSRKRPSSVKSLEAMDALFERTMAGNLESSLALQVLYNLKSSAVFYDRFLLKLNETIAYQKAPASDLAGIQMQSDDVLIREMKEVASLPGTGSGHILSKLIKANENRLKSGNFMKNLSAISRRPKLAFGFTAVILCAALSVYLLNQKLTRPQPVYYIYADKVPYEYDKTLLRDSLPSNEDQPELHRFIYQFHLAMSEYMIQNYASALSVFKSLELAANELTNKSDSQGWIRDYYFYYGLSCLSLAEKQGESENEQNSYLQCALANLTKADSLAQEKYLKERERELYFLGLAYYFANQADSSMAKWNQIPQGSRFYNDIQLLKKRLP